MFYESVKSECWEIEAHSPTNDNSYNKTRGTARDKVLGPDLDEVINFLRLLDPSSESFSFQTFDDGKEKRKDLVKLFHGSVGEVQDNLEALNDDGAGVFVTVQETDLRGRTADNIIRVRAIYADFDDGLPDNLPIPPSITVQSSPDKFQCYWLCDGVSDDEFASTMERLIHDYKADKRAKDLSRVLRLPGFYHRKGEPFLVKVLEASGIVYSRDEILEAFSVLPDKPKMAAPASNNADVSGIREALTHIPSDGYNEWRDVGFALHHEFRGSQEGYEIWTDWSKSSSKFSEAVSESTWRSFRTSHARPITVGTIFYMAQANGWANAAKSIGWPDLAKNGKPDCRSQSNIKRALNYLDIKVFFDGFLNEYLIQYSGADRVRLDEKCLRNLWLRVERLGCKCQKDYFGDVIRNMAEDNTCNACLDYLQSLSWDGKPRLDKLLIRYCGAEDNDFNRAIGRKLMVAAVRRARQPGVKFDHLLTLEGDQGVGKSSFARILAGDEWFTDCVRLGDDPKIIAEQTRGKWIVELPELVGINKKETEQIKSMLTRQTDSARMAYDRTTSHLPRPFVFIGTTNADHYLIDTTGNRRFWPVKVKKIDLEALSADRDQLWAEAAHLEAQNEVLWLPQDLEEAAIGVQRSRELVDPLENRLKELVSEKYGTIPKEELFAGLGLDGQRTAGRKIGHDKLIDRVMKNEGWTSGRRRNPNKFGSTEDNRRTVFYRQGPYATDNVAWWTYELDRKCLVRSDY